MFALPQVLSGKVHNEMMQADEWSANYDYNYKYQQEGSGGGYQGMKYPIDDEDLDFSGSGSGAGWPNERPSYRSE